MASLQQRLIETIINDFEKIKTLEPGKDQRNECNLLLKRIESAKKLFIGDSELTSKLLEIDKRINVLRCTL